MFRSILPLILLFAQVAHAQFDSELLAAAEPTEYIACSALESKRPARSEADFAFGQLRLINQAHTVKAYVSGFSQKSGTTYRIMRSVAPDLGWEFIAEGVTTTEKEGIAVHDENPLPGRVLYKLETIDADGKNQILDIRVVNRPLGMDLADVDFLATPDGMLTLPAADLPKEDYTVTVYDLQGGEVPAETFSFGERLKVSTDGLSFGVYQIIITGKTTAVKKYFLASGNY